MIISDLLGIDMEKITILQSDTDEIPRGQGRWDQDHSKPQDQQFM